MNKRVLLKVVFSVIALVCICTIKSDASINLPDWLVGEPVYQKLNESLSHKKCVRESRNVTGIYPRVYNEDDPNKTQLPCVYKADGYEYAYYYRSYYIYPTWHDFGTFGEAGVAVSIDGGDLHPVPALDSSSGDDLLYLGQSRGYVRQFRNQYWAKEFEYYKDFTQHLKPVGDGTYDIYGQPDYVYSDSAGNHAGADGVGASSNGKWITFDSPNVGMILFDAENLTARRISDRYEKQSYTWPAPVPVSSISDDGRYVVVGGWNVPTEVITINDVCGVAIGGPLADAQNKLGEKNCPFRDITSITNSHSEATGTAGYKAFLDVKMSADGGHFEYFDNYSWHIIYAENARPLSYMRYLALGDSFASGEGDLSQDGNDYYLAGTNVYGDYLNNVPREMCHISSRSYPFLISVHEGLTAQSNMRSVACSGAVTGDITSYDGTNISSLVDKAYLGQNTQGISWGSIVPRLKGMANISQLQEDARTGFVPGRIQQIEFVEKTKPELVTIMAGGNDMKFGEVMSECAKNFSIGIGVSCKYAGQEGRKELAQIIYSQYPHLVNTFSAIKQAGSRYTKVYAIGYPRLISATNPVCMTSFDHSERVSITQAIDYANAVIKQAAASAGVNYIDISDALDGNELCSGGLKYKYITFLSQLTYSKLASEVMKGKQAKGLFDKKSLSERAMQTDLGFFENYMIQRGKESYSEFSYSPSIAFGGMMQQMIHPNSSGHAAMYSSIIKNFGADGLSVCKSSSRLACNERADPSLIAPSPISYMSGINIQSGKVYINGDGPVSLESRVHEKLIDTGNAIRKGEDVMIHFVPKPNWGKFTGMPSVALHSDPFELGKMQQLEQGDYSLQVHIPPGVPVGGHTLYITAQTQTGQGLVVVKDVIVEGPLGDIDDDGIVDANDSCAFDRPNGQDIDNDGIADNCDLSVDAPSINNSESFNKSAAKVEGKVEEIAFLSSAADSRLGGPFFETDSSLQKSTDGLTLRFNNNSDHSHHDSEDNANVWLYPTSGALVLILVLAALVAVRFYH